MNNAGAVDKPKENINIKEVNGLPEDIAIIKAAYTKPHGKNPKVIPRKNPFRFLVLFDNIVIILLKGFIFIALKLKKY